MVRAGRGSRAGRGETGAPRVPSPRAARRGRHAKRPTRRLALIGAALTAVAAGLLVWWPRPADPVATTPAAVLAAEAPAPYPTVAPPSTFVPMGGLALASLLRSLTPQPLAGGVHLPAGTPPPVLPPSGGWLPARRIVAYYGNPLSPAMGVLGWYPPAQDMARLLRQAAAYTALTPSRPAVPAIDLVADVAQGSPGRGGLYRLRMPYSMMEQELALARRYHALLILDLQVGRSTVAAELPYYLPFLAQPDVELALDPEFDMPPGEVPGKWIGTMPTSQINWAIDQMSRLVAQRHLPPKVVIVHQFTRGMVPNWRGIRPRPGVQFVLDTDGYGGQVLKLANYRRYITDHPIAPVRYGGMKLFYKYDVNLLSPAQVVALHPSPGLVIYQ